MKNTQNESREITVTDTEYIITSKDINDIKKIASKASMHPRILQELVAILTSKHLKRVSSAANNVASPNMKVYPEYVGGDKHNQ